MYDDDDDDDDDSGVKPSRSAKAFLRGGPKTFEFFTISRL